MRCSVVLLFALMCGGSAPVWADGQPVAGSGLDLSGSGVLTLTTQGDGSVQITDLSGDYVGALAGVNTFNGNDNRFLPNQPIVLTPAGFAFTASVASGDDTGSYEVDLFADSGSKTGYSAYLEDQDADETTVPVDFTLSQGDIEPGPAGTVQRVGFAFASSVTPEPASLALMGTGLLGGVALVQRRRRAS